MKKTIVSLAFLAASGGYVVYANHAFDSLPSGVAGPQETATAALVVPKLPSPASTVILDEAPQASLKALARKLPSLPAATSPATVPAPVASPVATVDPVPAAPPLPPVVPTVVAPPVPRHRPADVPVIETAQATTVATNGSQFSDGTYTGTNENAYYGRVQVSVTIVGNRITSVTPLDYPQDRRTSRYINGQALPMLQQEVISAQSANIDTISGATLTSEAYIRSLGTALRKATGGNA